MHLGCPRDPRTPKNPWESPRAPKNLLAYPLKSKKYRWNCPLPASELPPRAPKRKINAVDITFSWWNFPPSAPKLTFIPFTFVTNWNDNCSFSLTLLSKCFKLFMQMFIWRLIWRFIQGVSKKAHHKVLCSFCLISPETNMLEGLYKFQGIHSSIWSTKLFLP